MLLAKVGLLAKPLETRYGYHVVKVNRYTQGQQLKFEDVQEKIANYLNDRVRNKAIAQYIQNLIADAEIEGYDFSLSASPLVQ